ncbi:MAG: alpha/beta fold hydrolase [Filifactoraceae bacterium]
MYEQINKIQQFNFQINRVLTYGEAAGNRDIIKTKLSTVKDLTEWFAAWLEIATKAEQAKQYMHAAYAYRMAEFFLKADAPQKELAYEKATINFYAAFDEMKLPYVICDIPYKGTYLHSVKIGTGDNDRLLLICGGYDSFVEEFFLPVLDLLDKGYTIILFEGDGQGKTLKNGLPFISEWEEPTKCVLDHFQVQSCTMIGISWGGYLAMRAAAFEKRISAIVAYDVAYDGFEVMTNVFPPLLRGLIRHNVVKKNEKVVNWLVKFAMSKSVLADWAFSQGQYITHTNSPYAFFEEVKKHTLKNISENITQDCLLLAGEKDHYIPHGQFERLKRNLPNAHSVKSRMFCQEEGGDQHCQIGNHSLAIDEIIKWLNR